MVEDGISQDLSFTQDVGLWIVRASLRISLFVFFCFFYDLHAPTYYLLLTTYHLLLTYLLTYYLLLTKVRVVLISGFFYAAVAAALVDRKSTDYSYQAYNSKHAMSKQYTQAVYAVYAVLASSISKQY